MKIAKELQTSISDFQKAFAAMVKPYLPKGSKKQSLVEETALRMAQARGLSDLLDTLSANEKKIKAMKSDALDALAELKAKIESNANGFPRGTTEADKQAALGLIKGMPNVGKLVTSTRSNYAVEDPAKLSAAEAVLGYSLRQDRVSKGAIEEAIEDHGLTLERLGLATKESQVVSLRRS